MGNFEKIVRVGTSERRSIFCKIIWKEGRLSISGVHGPTPNGNAISCGQILIGDPRLTIEKFAPGWNEAKRDRFAAIWKRWHLNDMRAGTPAQMAELEKHEFPGYPVSHYTWAQEILKAAGLDPDNGYQYGHRWLREEVPQDILEWLVALPDTDKQPAWV